MKETLEEVAKNESEYLADWEDKDMYKKGFVEGAKWQAEQNSWKSVSEETPPTIVELLVKSPNGVIYLSNWRESYDIFCCQEKSESSFDWKWKTI